MSELVLRPRSATELIDAAFQVYRRAPAPFIIATALVYVPWFALWLLLAGDMVTNPGQLPPNIGFTLLITSIASILLYALIGGVMSVLARAAYLDEPTDIAGAFKLTFTRLFALIVSAIVQFVLIMIGFVLFIIPGIYLVARFFAVPQAIVFEGAGPFAALGRSGVLSKGRKWHILITLFLIVVLTTIIDGGALLVFNMLGSKILANVLMIALATVLVPLFGITQTLLYFDSRIRKEGFDVEYLAGAPASAPTPGATA
jgi:hypothetical protein